MPTPPRTAGFTAALFAVGLGLTMYYGYALYKLPSYTAAELDQSAQMNLMLDYQRLGQTPPADPARVKHALGVVRAELDAADKKEHQDILRALGAGIIALAIALGQLVLMRATRK